MADSWLQRLVVRGPAAEVAAFELAAASPDRPTYVTVRQELRAQRLSFKKLCGLLPSHQARRFDRDLEEPWDLLVDRPRRSHDGSREVTYKFQLSSFEPENLVIHVSRMYPRLCFVVACVAPAVDQQASLLVHKGETWQWRLPDKRKDAICKKLVPEETAGNADEVDWGLAQADWQMMDELVAHWQPKMDALMPRLLKESRPGRERGPRPPSRRRRRT